MAQVASVNSVKIKNNNNDNNKQKALCPFYGSSHGCPYLDKCSLSHTNPNSIELCPLYQLSNKGCLNPDSCYYRHSLLPLSRKELNKLQTKHKIPGKIQYSRIIKGNSVHRVIIIINRVLWYGIHFIIEDNRLQKIHHERYCAIYYWNDAILVSELIATIILKSKCPGKYLSYLKNLIDGDTEPGKDKKNKNKKLVHYRDILSSIGNNFKEIPKPINPHLVKNLSRVPWVDFKLLPLPFEVYEHPEIFLKPGDLVRIWRPKKFVYHCGVYLGNERVIHISNGYKGDDGLSWRNSFSLFQSGSAPTNKQYYDYGKKMKQDKEQMKLEEDEEVIDGVAAEKQEDDEVVDGEGSEGSYDKINAPDVAVYDDDDDMDLVDDDSDEEQQQEEEELKQDEYVEETRFNDLYGEKEEEEKKSELLYQDMDEIKEPMVMDEKQQEYARRARECSWKQFLVGSRKKDLELGFFVFPWRTPEEIVYTAKFLTEIHYMKGQYSVLKNNCEHFSLYCCTGLRYSPQSNTIENVLTAVSKIGLFAGNIFSKATSFRNKNKDKKPKEKEPEEKEKANENRKNHPVIQEQELDDGGDDELEKILLNDNNNNNNKDILVMDDKKLLEKQDKENKEKGDEFDISIDINGNDNDKKSSVFIDEYANDEEDVLAQSIILEQNEDINNNLEHLSRMNSLENMTPGGLTMSEILSAKKHYNQQRREEQQNQQKWDV